MFNSYSNIEVYFLLIFQTAVVTARGDPNRQNNEKNKLRVALWISAAYVFIVALAYAFPSADDQEVNYHHSNYFHFIII